MYKFITVVIFLMMCLCLTPIFSQNQAEFGLALGITNYHGDLAENNVELSSTNYGLGVLYRKPFHSKLAFRGNLLIGLISGTDEIAEDENKAIRNLSFKSNIFETSAIFEFYPFKKAVDGNSIDSKIFQPQFNPYFFAGVGVTVAQSSIDMRESGTLDKLPGTEGTNAMLSIPFGGGLRYDFAENLSLSLEGSLRYTNLS
ncbi:MAG: DUF6089 family protein [Bacteroidota bacterium]